MDVAAKHTINVLVLCKVLQYVYGWFRDCLNTVCLTGLGGARYWSRTNIWKVLSLFCMKHTHTLTVPESAAASCWKPHTRWCFSHALYLHLLLVQTHHMCLDSFVPSVQSFYVYWSFAVWVVLYENIVWFVYLVTLLECISVFLQTTLYMLHILLLSVSLLFRHYNGDEIQEKCAIIRYMYTRCCRVRMPLTSFYSCITIDIVWYWNTHTHTMKSSLCLISFPAVLGDVLTSFSHAPFW